MLGRNTVAIRDLVVVIFKIYLIMASKYPRTRQKGYIILLQMEWVGKRVDNFYCIYCNTLRTVSIWHCGGLFLYDN